MQEPEAKLTWRDDGQVATVAVRGRTRLNVLNTTAIDRATEAIQRAGSGERVRCVVLEGADDGSFIGGADIAEMVNLSPETAREFITKLHELCRAVVAVPVVVVAKVRGHALGGGMEVAMACDLRVSSRSARWGMPEVRVGLPSVIEAALLPRLVGWGRAASLLYRGHLVDGDEAHRIGLCDEVADDASLDAAVRDVVLDVLRGGPAAIRTQKRLLRAWAERPLDDCYRMSIDEFARAYETDEPREGLTSFLEKREARYVSGD